MLRTLLLFGAGLLLAAATLLLVPERDTSFTTDAVRVERPTPSATPPAAPATAPSAIRFLELATGSIDTAELEALEGLAAAADAATLAAVAAQLAVLPKLPSRALALEVVLARYADIDARAAIALARELGLEPGLIAPLFPPSAQSDAADALPLPDSLQALALLEPARALDAARSLPAELGAMVRRAALLGLARDEPLAALTHAEALPPGLEREQLLGAIAHAYGRFDPTAAVAWAQASGSPAALASVVSGVARVDPDRALELAFALPGMQEQQRVLNSLVASGTLSASHTVALVDRLLAQPGRSTALRVLAGMWAQRAPADALPWLLENRGLATTSAIAQAGMSLARNDPAAAVGYFEQIPSELRASWLGAVAEGYAQNDAGAAAAWLAAYRDAPGYDAAAAAVAARTALTSPAAAARMFAAVDVARVPGAASSASAIAGSWARQDAAAAGAWARELADAEVAAGALGAVARQWATSDAGAAREWALRLPADARRDAALVQILGATAGTPADDPALIEAFSSPAARQTGVNDAVRIVAARDLGAAQQLADLHLTDASLRRSAELYLGRNPAPPAR